MTGKILYIEDEPFLGKIVKETLENQGFEILLIVDGGQVMNAFKSFTPDICVLDVMLPNVDGFTLGGLIKKSFPELPIIFLTAKVEIDDLVKGFENGAVDYIRKPFSTKELIVRIESQLKLRDKSLNTDTARSETITLGDFIFHRNKFELEYEGKIQKLSSRESEVLSLLADSRNKTLDRKTILMDIWGDNDYYNSRTLDVYIRKLRKYFAPDKRIEIITLKGKGYHFIVP